jgi:hypothetical protein
VDILSLIAVNLLVVTALGCTIYGKWVKTHQDDDYTYDELNRNAAHLNVDLDKLAAWWY